MQIQATHSLDFFFGFHFFFFNYMDIYFTQITLYISFAKIICESEKNLLILQFFWTKIEFETPRKHVTRLNIP
jgi:hypothetical protein